MELEILKKKLSSFRTNKGYLKGVSDELLLEILSRWELWTGSSKDFYTGIGSNKAGIAAILKKAKRLKREGASMPFQPFLIEGVSDSLQGYTPLICDIEVQDKNKIIRFRNVDSLIEYLKKAA